jgi:hypothetical protein
MLTLTLVWVLVLVLMLVTAPLVEGRVVNRPPSGQVSTSPAPVKQEVIVEVVKTVVVDGVERRGVVVMEADRKVVEAMAWAGVDVAVLPPPPSPRPSPPPRVTPRSTPSVGSSPRLKPDETPSPSPKPTSADSDTPRVAETPALRIGLPDGPRTTPPLTPAPTPTVAVASMQPLSMLPPLEQVVIGIPPDVGKVTIPDGSEADNDGMRVVAGRVEGSVPPGNSDEITDETPFPTAPGT